MENNEKILNNLLQRVELTEGAMEELVIVLQTLNKIFTEKGIYDIDKFHALMEEVAKDEKTNFRYRDNINKVKESFKESEK
ncbi:hypothetical protein [Clostridium pasteurianum]|uniref:Uncharacterized protein n=1 Tax=Clostridium pasteurianum BC1 TaxID=86416 RepID=R4K282_CLOPA|nr:hypothetical protein [Clostridium pasteurianum]AGK97207.1 hypothetical protein Clopa_2343 [Clostridium pasteurianum BC1]